MDHRFFGATSGRYRPLRSAIPSAMRKSRPGLRSDLWSGAAPAVDWSPMTPTGRMPWSCQRDILGGACVLRIVIADCTSGCVEPSCTFKLRQNWHPFLTPPVLADASLVPRKAICCMADVRSPGPPSAEIAMAC